MILAALKSCLSVPPILIVVPWRSSYLFKKMLSDKKIEGVEVVSRGIAATDHSPISKIGQALLLAENGVYAETHRSKKIEESDIREADIVLAMEQFHVQFLKEKYPFAIQKIDLLSDYGGMPDLERLWWYARSG